MLQAHAQLRPNPSIERDVRGLAPSAAPHVKRSVARVRDRSSPSRWLLSRSTVLHEGVRFLRAGERESLCNSRHCRKAQVPLLHREASAVAACCGQPPYGLEEISRSRCIAGIRRPCAEAQRLSLANLAPRRRERPRSSRFGYFGPHSQAPQRMLKLRQILNAQNSMRFSTQQPNPSIERTVNGLRPSPAAHVKR